MLCNRVMMICVLPLLLSSCAMLDEPKADGVDKPLRLGDGRIVVVSEGVLEARSIGSVTIRLYRGSVAEFPTDDFVSGIVIPRDGYITRAWTEAGGAWLWIDLESAGSGHYRQRWRCGFVNDEIQCQQP